LSRARYAHRPLPDGGARSTFRAPGRSRAIRFADDTDKEYLISLELPGLELADVDVRLSGNLLTVSGERKQKKEEDKNKHFYRMETTYGAFERRFELPQNVRTEPDSVQATFKNGILEIKVAKREPRPSAKITVKPS
jgi:HSP20 family protein